MKATIKASEGLKAYIKSVEYFRRTTQKDLRGRWVIGFGTETGALPSRIIELKEAEELLDKELDIISFLVANMNLGTLTGQQTDVIIRLCMLFGARSFRASKLYQYIKEGESDEVITKEIERFVSRDENKHWTKRERIEWLCASWNGKREEIVYTYNHSARFDANELKYKEVKMKKNKYLKDLMIRNWKAFYVIIGLSLLGLVVSIGMCQNKYQSSAEDSKLIVTNDSAKIDSLSVDSVQK